jgi:hypothetical protein
MVTLNKKKTNIIAMKQLNDNLITNGHEKEKQKFESPVNNNVIWLNFYRWL